MVKLVNRASMSSSTIGTGTVTLDYAKSGYQSFAAAGIFGGDIVRYVIEDSSGGWEIGAGVYTAAGTTLSRTPIESSVGGGAIALTGYAKVFVGVSTTDIPTGSTLGRVTGNDLDLSTGNFFEITANNQTLTFSAAPDVLDFNLKLTGSESINGYTLAETRYNNFLVAGQDSTPNGVAFSNDGTKMYVIGTAPATVNQYNLSIGFDLSTASYSSVSYNVSSQEATPTGLEFSTDGTRMYVVGYTNDTVYQYNLTTSFDVSTAAYASRSFAVNPQDNFPRDITFNTDGTKMFMVGVTNDSVHQYTLSTAYDIGTASYDFISLNVSASETGPSSLAFNDDGTKMYIIGSGSDRIFQYTLATAFDLSTAFFGSNSFKVGQESFLGGVAFSTDGTKMYVVGSANDTVYQYTLTTGFNVSTASYDNVSFSVAAQESNAAGLAFNDDGTMMYIIGYVSDSVHQYTLTAAFDISTASYGNISLSVSAQDGFPRSITFNNDGTKLYMVGTSSDSVHQYSLSNGFDLSTATYDSFSFSVASQEIYPTGFVFNDDGTKVYVVGQNTQTVYEYPTASVTTSTVTYPSSVNFPNSIVPAVPNVGEVDIIKIYTIDGGINYYAY